MKLIFLGTPQFAVPSLRALHKAGHSIALVISQPDRALDKKRLLLPTPIKECANTLNLSFLSMDNVNVHIDELKEFKPDAFITVAFGQMLGDEFLSIAPTLNVHGSLLPLYRGASPIQASIINGDKETGITIMQTVKKMDVGDILSQAKIRIESADTYGMLHDKLSIIGANLLVDTLKLMQEGKITPQSQDETKATYTKKITKQCGKIDWSKSATEIECQIRAYNPWPSAHTTYNKTGDIIKIHSAIACLDIENANNSLSMSDITSNNMAPVGTILHSTDKLGIYVKCGMGVLQITKLQAPSKKINLASEFLLGYKLENIKGKFE